MIWPVPRLHGADFMRWFARDDGELSLPAGYAARWYAGGAEALADICAQLAVQRGHRIDVLLPGYFCGQSLRYLRRLDVNLLFYPLTDGLQPDYDDIAHRASADVLIHVHYFGHVAGQTESRVCADALGAILIEDCAHVISPAVQVDWGGDYLIFAPHKLFPLPPVGLAFVRQPPGAPTAVVPFPYRWFVRQAARRVLSRAPATSWGRVWSGGAEEFRAACPRAWITRASTACLVGFDPAAAVRRANAARLRELLATVTGWQAFCVADEKDTPYLFGMLCASPELARQRFEALNQRARLVLQWPDLPVEICDTPRISNQCVDWVDKVLHFVVHQQLDSREWLNEVEKAIRTEEFRK